MNECMELRGHDWCVGTQKAEAGNTWLEPNQIKINTLIILKVIC